MFAIVLIFVLFTTYVTTEIPSYIHVCGRRNPNLDQCIIDSAYNLRSMLCEGIPEMEVPSIGPLRFSKLILSEANNIKLHIDELLIRGLCEFVINSVHLDLDKLQLNFNLSFTNIHFDCAYDFDIHVLVDVASKGPLSFTADSANAILQCNLKMITKKGKKYLYVSKLTTNLDLNNFEVKFENNDSDQLRQIVANFIGNNEKELLTTFTPVLEEAVSKVIIVTFNNILKRFTFDEIFPNRE